VDALVRQARAAWLPTLVGVGTYTRLDSDRVFPGAPATATSPATPAKVLSPKDSLNANLTLTVPIIVPQKWAAWSHAKYDAEAMRSTSGDVKRQVAVATGRAYLSIVAQRRILQANIRARNTARAHLEFSRTRLAGGIGNRI